MPNVTERHNSRVICKAPLKASPEVYGIDDCILPPVAVRLVEQESIFLWGRRYQHPALAAVAGEEVMVFRFDVDTVGVCLGSAFICAAGATSYKAPIAFFSAQIVRLHGCGRVGRVMYFDEDELVYLVRLQGDSDLTPLHGSEMTLLVLEGENS